MVDENTTVKTNTDICLTKIVLKEGDDVARPNEGCVCTIVCKVLSKHDKIDDRQIGVSLEQATRIRVGYFNTEISRYLHAAVETMRLKEVAEISFELNQKLIFPDESNIKTFVFIDLKFKIELLEIDFTLSLDRVYSFSVDELINLASEHKNDANQIFKDNLTLTAFYRYQRAIRYLIIAQQLNKSDKDHDHEEGIEEHLKDDKKKISDLKAVLYLNIAACQLKYPNNSENVIKNCTKCLEIDVNNVKALYRRAMAYSEMHDFESAIEDLRHALKIEANNKTVEEKLRQFEEFRKKKDGEMTHNLRKMFN